MSEYTPTLEEVRANLVLMGEKPRPLYPEEFDRWLNKVKAEAWEEGAESAFYNPEILGLVDYPENPYRKEQA